MKLLLKLLSSQHSTDMCMCIFATLKNSLENHFNFNMKKMKTREPLKNYRIQLLLIYKKRHQGASRYVGLKDLRKHHFHQSKLLFRDHIYKFKKESSSLLLAQVSHLTGICIFGFWPEMKSFTFTLDSKCQQFKVARFCSLNLPYCWMLQIERKQTAICYLEKHV